MSPDEQAELDVLKMATENGKLALQIGANFGQAKQAALQRLQLRQWLTLIDVSPIAEHPDRLFRIFLASESALSWLRAWRAN